MVWIVMELSYNKSNYIYYNKINYLKSNILENKLISNAYYSTLLSIVPSPGIWVTVAESLNRNLGKVSEWCDLWGMKSNASKTNTTIVSRSHTMHPQWPILTVSGTVLKESDDLYILGVTFIIIIIWFQDDFWEASSLGFQMRLLAAEPRGTAGLLFRCQYLCGTILVMVWDWRV